MRCPDFKGYHQGNLEQHVSCLSVTWSNLDALGTEESLGGCNVHIQVFWDSRCVVFSNGPSFQGVLILGGPHFRGPSFQGVLISRGPHFRVSSFQGALISGVLISGVLISGGPHFRGSSF